MNKTFGFLVYLQRYFCFEFCGTRCTALTHIVTFWGAGSRVIQCLIQSIDDVMRQRQTYKFQIYLCGVWLTVLDVYLIWDDWMDFCLLTLSNTTALINSGNCSRFIPFKENLIFYTHKDVIVSSIHLNSFNNTSACGYTLITVILTASKFKLTFMHWGFPLQLRQ